MIQMIGGHGYGNHYHGRGCSRLLCYGCGYGGRDGDNFGCDGGDGRGYGYGDGGGYGGRWPSHILVADTDEESCMVVAAVEVVR